jgi:prophage regulatory protein
LILLEAVNIDSLFLKKQIPLRAMPRCSFVAFQVQKGKNMAELIHHVKDALLRRQEVERLTGMGRSAIYARLDCKHPQYDRTFPRPVPMGTTSVRWISSEVDAWIKARIADRDARSNNAG